MIDIVTEKEASIKNVKQIGTPLEEDRIYLLDSAYKQMHENHFTEKSVYILMGHTEKSNGRYATFVEAVIPVENIEFEHNLPIWSNQVWKDIFYQIKNQYEDLIIVGWGMDRKGYSTNETPELEKVHREQFGGVHQLLFLMNSLEQEEYFYINKNNRLYKKSGFFIYYQINSQLLKMKLEQEQKEKQEETKVDIEIPEEFMTKEASTGAGKGRYRQLLKQQNSLESMTTSTNGRGATGKTLQAVDMGMLENKERRSSMGLVAAIAMLVVAVGGNAMTHGYFSTQVKSAMETMGQSVDTAKTHSYDSMESVSDTESLSDTENLSDAESSSESENEKDGDKDKDIPKIPVEEY